MDRPLIIPFFIPHAGCPFTCVFCNQWGISGTVESARPEDVRPRVLKYIAARKGKPIRSEAAFFGGSFTGLDQEIQKGFLEAAFSLKQEGLIQGIRLSTRPDYISREIIHNLLAYGVTTIELGVQSLIDTVLEKSCRGHTYGDVVKAAQIIRDYPFELIFQLMLGLPGDTRELAATTAKRAVKLAPDGVRIYPALVIKGTVLENWFNAGSYKPWGLEEAVESGSLWLSMFTANDIRVIRLGLQAADNLSPDRDLVTGPYHPAYGELVYSRLMLKQARGGIDLLRDKNGLLKVYCNPRDYSIVRGQNNVNIKDISQVYDFSQIKIIRDPDIKRQDLRIETEKETRFLARQEFLKKYRINSTSGTGTWGLESKSLRV